MLVLVKFVIAVLVVAIVFGDASRAEEYFVCAEDFFAEVPINGVVEVRAR